MLIKYTYSNRNYLMEAQKSAKNEYLRQKGRRTIPYILINYTLNTVIHMQKIAPCLWFDDKAEEAAKFYVSIFKNSEGDADGQFDLPYGVLHLLHGAYC
jgi:hypothetical protein